MIFLSDTSSVSHEWLIGLEVRCTIVDFYVEKLVFLAHLQTLFKLNMYSLIPTKNFNSRTEFSRYDYSLLVKLTLMLINARSKNCSSMKTLST